MATKLNLDNSGLGKMVCDIINNHNSSNTGLMNINMEVEDFVKAVMLIATSNSCKVQYMVPVKDNYSHTYDILILESNAKIIEVLIKEGYSLAMSSKGLAVYKY